MRCASDLPPTIEPSSPFDDLLLLDGLPPPPPPPMPGNPCMKSESPTLKMICLDDGVVLVAGISAIVARVAPWALKDTGPFGWHHSLANTYLRGAGGT